jgi:hypothetical protein
VPAKGLSEALAVDVAAQRVPSPGRTSPAGEPRSKLSPKLLLSFGGKSTYDERSIRFIKATPE